VATRTVVNAAGAWAAEVAKFAGLELPVEPLRRMLVPSEPSDEFPHSSPMVTDISNGFHFRPEGRGFLLAWNDLKETSGYKTHFDFREAFREDSSLKIPVTGIRERELDQQAVTALGKSAARVKTRIDGRVEVSAHRGPPIKNWRLWQRL
jgi:glycine/D-amino acid oxidase-like deaminating enzyme